MGNHNFEVKRQKIISCGIAPVSLREQISISGLTVFFFRLFLCPLPPSVYF